MHRSPKKILLATVALATLIFYLDVLIPRGETSAMLFVAVVGATLWLPGLRPVFVATLACTLLTVLGFILSPPGPIASDLVNRSFSVLAFWLVALLCVLYKRSERDCLRLASIVESSEDAILSKTLEGIIVSWNRGAEKLFGYTAEEVQGRPVSLMIPPDRLDEEARAIEAVQRGHRIEHIETLRLRKDGGQVPVSLSVSPVRDAAGKVVAISSIATDITGRKRADEDLRRAKAAAEEASRAKSEFLANMSHEIRTPLSAILGFSEVLRQGVAEEAERRDYLDTISSSGKHLLTMIDDILDLSKVEAGRMEIATARCSPHRVVADVLSVLRVRAAEKGLRLECRWDGATPEWIETDPARLRQLLMNLVGNAIKFTERGEVLVVATVTPHGPEPRLAIEVRDTGIGIDAEHLERIFLPFDQADGSITRRFGGTGLGLTISRHIAHALGGDITVANRPGHGSVFRATLATGPLDQAGMWERPPCEALSSSSPARAAAGRLHGSRVLLVEDGETNRKLIRLVLQRAGAEVVCIEDGRAGVEAAAVSAFDLILMDMQMPVMDGYQATGLIRAGGFAGPILALTAHAMRGDEEKCLAAGCSGYLTKPIDVNALIGAVRGALDSAGPSGPPPAPTASTAAFPRPPVTSALPTEDPEFRAIVEGFVATLAVRLPEMRGAWERGAWIELSRLAHWLKGAGGTVGFDVFTGPAAHLEHHADRGRTEEAEEALRELDDLVARIVVLSDTPS